MEEQKEATLPVPGPNQLDPLHQSKRQKEKANLVKGLAENTDHSESMVLAALYDRVLEIHLGVCP